MTRALVSWLMALLLPNASGGEPASLFAKPGKRISVGHGSRLSMYCAGTGSPVVLLESGFGGGTAATWMRLQPLLGSITRTCSYDRAGYGFSSLGSNLPRDLDRAVADLALMLQRSGAQPPYILAGHSNGGLLIGAYADRHPERVAGLLFFDAAVALPEDRSLPTTPAGKLSLSAQTHLERIRRCLARAESRMVPAERDECVDPTWYARLPPDLAAAEIANHSKVDYWRAYLSEAESNYGSKLSEQARALLPHQWTHLPVRVFTASVSAMDDASAAQSLGIDSNDQAALAQARAARANGERRQQRLCEFVSDCRAISVPTANHMVHNEVLPQVVEVVRDLVARARRR